MERKSSAGKGDSQRPFDRDKYEEGYKRIFYCKKCKKHVNKCACLDEVEKGD
jgi:hypothetical protein